MVIVGQVKVSGLSFRELAKQLLKTGLGIGKSAKRIDAVFDKYEEHAEQTSRSSKLLGLKILFPVTQLCVGPNSFLLDKIKEN